MPARQDPDVMLLMRCGRGMPPYDDTRADRGAGRVAVVLQPGGPQYAVTPAPSTERPWGWAVRLYPEGTCNVKLNLDPPEVALTPGEDSEAYLRRRRAEHERCLYPDCGGTRAFPCLATCTSE